MDEVRVVLYSHDSQGLGHTRRNLAIAHELAARLPALLHCKVSGLLITGEGTATTFEKPAGWDWVVLPGICKREGAYAPRHLGIEMNHMTGLRSRIIGATLAAFRPDPNWF